MLQEVKFRNNLLVFIFAALFFIALLFAKCTPYFNKSEILHNQSIIESTFLTRGFADHPRLENGRNPQPSDLRKLS